MPPWLQGWGAWRAALANYRTWILSITYGLSFGTELTIDNILAQYLFDHFDVSGQLLGCHNLHSPAGMLALLIFMLATTTLFICCETMHAALNSAVYCTALLYCKCYQQLFVRPRGGFSWRLTMARHFTTAI